jgi:predicted DNA-binding protein
MVKKSDPRPKPFSIRLEPQLRAQLEALADADQRTLTNYLLKVIREHVRGVDKAR